MSQDRSISIRRTLGEALSEHDINGLGRATGQSKRLRVVTPFRLVSALLVALGTGATETIADLRRELNFQHNTTTAYKPFYLRLARPAFAKFMRAVAIRLMERLAMRVLKPAPDSPLARFTDVVIQDGSSFALKRCLRRTFPRRFKTIEPAAVEVHATFSGFADDVLQAHVAPDTAAERRFLPAPETLQGKLLLADRGDPSQPYFRALDAAGASYLVRLSRSWKPRVVAMRSAGRRIPLPRPIGLEEVLSQHPACALDLEIQLGKGRRAFHARLVVLPGKERHRTRLCTNLGPDEFPIELVSHVYRFRWQIERLFKEWKSYANLRTFDTRNKTIVRGLIWASLAAATIKRFIAHAAEAATGVPISTRTVAMCARQFLRKLLAGMSHPLRPSSYAGPPLGMSSRSWKPMHDAPTRNGTELAAGSELACRCAR